MPGSIATAIASAPGPQSKNSTDDRERPVAALEQPAEEPEPDDDRELRGGAVVDERGGEVQPRVGAQRVQRELGARVEREREPDAERHRDEDDRRPRLAVLVAADAGDLAAAQAAEARLGGLRLRPCRAATFGRPRAPAPRDARRGGLAGGASGRSIFGARLRSRVPQYGHSVTYGLTSAWQFLHTTKRSGWDMRSILRSGRARSAKSASFIPRWRR